MFTSIKTVVLPEKDQETAYFDPNRGKRFLFY